MAVSREFKVGAFTLAGLLVVGLVVFLIGEERKLFESKLLYHVSFQDVQGLRRGSPVRMGGVDIGSVTEVAYDESPEDKRIHVKMDIVKGEARRIRQDSVATIEGKGLLGARLGLLEDAEAHSKCVSVHLRHDRVEGFAHVREIS